jgi:uncharacterized membrane protein
MNHTDPVPSTAAIAGHPIHPMLVVFPIAFLIAAFFTDLAARRTGSDFWAWSSFWLTSAGLAMGALAALFGTIDFVTIPRAREHLDGWVHLIGNIAVLGLALLSLVVRRRTPKGTVSAPAFALSATSRNWASGAN